MFDNSLSSLQSLSGSSLQSPQQPPYLVIDGIKLGEDDPIDEPRCLGHGVISQGLVELDLSEKKDPRNAFVVPPLSNSPVKPTEKGSSPSSSLRSKASILTS